MKQFFLVKMAALFCSAMLLNFAQAAVKEEGRQVFVETNWVDLKSSESSVVDLVILFFHDGSFDLYNDREPASSLLQRLVKRDFTDWRSLEALAPGTVVSLLNGPHEIAPGEGPLFGELSTSIVTLIDTSQHRYVTAFIGLRPSNDAFLANENPYRLELFDLSGTNQLPLTIDFFGSEVLDAGACTNTEAGLYLLDTTQVSEQECVAENGVVRAHPGYNGSVRNPSGTPKRILDATSVDMGGLTGLRHYDEVDADFTRPGAKIGRLIFTFVESFGSQSGSWYSPSHDGEGFNIEVFRRADSDHDEMIVYWYTYDSAGRPLWLIGNGTPNGTLRMYSARGGRLGSETNPGNVVREFWGTLRVNLNQFRERCPRGGAITYTPADTSQPAGRIEIQRLAPRGSSSQRLCEQLYPPLGNAP